MIQKIPFYLLIVFFHWSCNQNNPETTTEPGNNSIFRLSLDEANKLAALPMKCIGTEYPNKPGQVLSEGADLGEPAMLHPAFYGCFDWHSSVHGHWSLVQLLKQFPELDHADSIRNMLARSLSLGNIRGELDYFMREESYSFERTYGWAWLLKLAEELHTWDDPLAGTLEMNLQPLTDLIVYRFKEFLPKLVYPIRVGEHTNTAFALSFAWDYARALEDTAFEALIDRRARSFYLTDQACPQGWEPSGFDFLSPCLEEADLMRRVLPKKEFMTWIQTFMPDLSTAEFKLSPGIVSDRTDGKLVHLDGLNFSRAWVLYGLAEQYPESFGHLIPIANTHIEASLPNLVDDSYEGGHWLGSFALYALGEELKENGL